MLAALVIAAALIPVPVIESALPVLLLLPLLHIAVAIIVGIAIITGVAAVSIVPVAGVSASRILPA